MSTAVANSRIVSSESEQLILVNAQDEPIGFASKGDAHDGDGILHRAFSLFIFNDDGELLLQQRAEGKRLWGGYWSNSCCSHPRAGERMDEAVHRRLEQELGMTAQLDFLYKFEYQAQFGDLGSEHELCWVYLGRTRDEVRANETEIASWRYVAPADLDRELAQHPERFTPWFKLEWARIADEFRDALDRLTRPAA
ncbi:MAG: isopentenyl-diphosphate Delta-isomerase [Pseudomonadota bacterium]